MIIKGGDKPIVYIDNPGDTKSRGQFRMALT
jgi:hypothetical protein